MTTLAVVQAGLGSPSSTQLLATRLATLSGGRVYAMAGVGTTPALVTLAPSRA